MKQRAEITYLFQLMYHALKKSVPPVPSADMDWNFLFEVCKAHQVANIAAYALEQLPSKQSIPVQIQQSFAFEKKKGIARELVQNFEFHAILNEMEKAEIETIPLKGSVIKNYYPSPDMRFLTDLDILYKKEQCHRVERIMNQLEYETSLLGIGCHDLYTKEPYMSVEMHWTCFDDKVAFGKLTEHVWERSKRQNGYQYSYAMCWEDYYTYMIAHMAKHFQRGGIGIRMLLDLFVFEEQLMARCDRAYIEKVLQEVGILQFEQTIRKRIDRWINEETSIQAEDPLLDCILGSGAHGTIKNYYQNRSLEGKAKKRNVFQRWWEILRECVFLKLEIMQQWYPCLKKYPVLLPVFWMIRLVKKVVTKPWYCVDVFHGMTNKNELEQIEKARKEVGME